MAALGGTAIAVFVAAWVALGSGNHHAAVTGQELYNIDRQPKADGLAALPSGYDKVQPPALGAPLPGDLGPAELRARQGLGVPTVGTASENDTARAEELRLAQLSRQANEGGIFLAHPQATAVLLGLLPTQWVCRRLSRIWHNPAPVLRLIPHAIRPMRDANWISFTPQTGKASTIHTKFKTLCHPTR